MRTPLEAGWTSEPPLPMNRPRRATAGLPAQNRPFAKLPDWKVRLPRLFSGTAATHAAIRQAALPMRQASRLFANPASGVGVGRSHHARWLPHKTHRNANGNAMKVQSTVRSLAQIDDVRERNSLPNLAAALGWRSAGPPRSGTEREFQE